MPAPAVAPNAPAPSSAKSAPGGAAADPTTPPAGAATTKGKTKPKRGRKPLLIIVALAVLVGGAGGGWWWWKAKQAAEQSAKSTQATARKPAIYFAMEPAFVVNLMDEEPARYLQADLQLMTRDPATNTAFETHAPAIRNRLLLLFGQQSSLQLAQRSGKERLQEAALGEVRRLLKAEGAPDKVEAVFFTSLVTQ